MSNPQFIQVPRDQDPSPNTAHQSTSYSKQMNAWLREDHKQMPWHNLAYVATSGTQDNSTSSSEPTPSGNPATQGSTK
ncbi:Ff.00g033610.m01.CDS01 [Fusarium sp. VM40]|nr:Ff.00g033610.m01.CDS01 [Fusarium sp. VM40]